MSDEEETDNDCHMWFFSKPCRYQSRSRGKLTEHQRKIHEPEMLKCNGYDGVEDPILTHVNYIRANGKVEKYLMDREGRMQPAER